MSSVNQIESLFGFSVNLMDLISNSGEIEQRTKNKGKVIHCNTRAVNSCLWGTWDSSWDSEFRFRLLNYLPSNISLLIFTPPFCCIKNDSEINFSFSLTLQSFFKTMFVHFERESIN